MIAALSSCLLFAACAEPSLEGDWVGEMDCEDETAWMELEIDLPLTDAGDGEFTGRFEADGDYVYDGETYPVRITADLEAELTSDEVEQQTIELLWSDCEIRVSDESTDDCLDGEWGWDGEDTLSGSNENCDLVLER